MLQNLKDWYADVKENGIKFLYAFDSERKSASSTLFYCYVSFYFVLASLIALHFKSELLTATAVTITFFSICMIFYRLRKIDKLKVDLDDKSLEVENNEGEEKK